MYTAPTPPPPLPPPKPSSHDVSRLGTPVGNSPRPPPPVPDNGYSGGLETMGISHGQVTGTDASGLIPAPIATAMPRGTMRQQQPQQPVPDPGDTWLPGILEDKS
jgi:hypothetical protein